MSPSLPMPALVTMIGLTPVKVCLVPKPETVMVSLPAEPVPPVMVMLSSPSAVLPYWRLWASTPTLR